jgi:hypothetical protein
MDTYVNSHPKKPSSQVVEPERSEEGDFTQTQISN